MRLSLRRRTAQPAGPRPNQWRGPRADSEISNATIGPTRVRRLCRLAGWTALIVLSAWAAVLATRELPHLMKQWFAIHDVTVKGLNHVTREEVMARMNLKPDATLYQVSASFLAERLRVHPWIKDATFERVPFHELSVTIIERTPAAIVRNGAEHLLTDEEGIVLARLGAQDDPALPLLTGLDAKGLLQGDVRARKAVRAGVQLSKLMAHAYDGRPEINAGNPSNLVASVKGVRFQFGEQALDDQWDRFRKVQASLKTLAVDGSGRRPNEVDLRYDNRVIVRERG